MRFSLVFVLVLVPGVSGK